jgi:dCTP deaminase
MPFWSGDKLAVELPNLISPYTPNAIECASYELSVGDQAFVTKDDLTGDGPTASLTQILRSSPPRDTVVIPPGQFAFLMTEESIKVPENAIALISMKAKIKFRGLINVSGFHVDPGFSGKLVFSMYNAGPREIILHRKQRLFLIVYADLDSLASSRYAYQGAALGQAAIKTEWIEQISSGQVFSPMRLQREMSEIKSDLTEVRIRSRLIDGIVLTSIGIFVSVFIGVAAALFASDTAVATVGWWIKSAIKVYDEKSKTEKRDASSGGDDKAAEEKSSK